MSDVAKCPHCQKFIDITIMPETCPKCHTSLKDINLSNEVFEQEKSSFWDAPKLVIIFFGTAFVGALIKASPIIAVLGLVVIGLIFGVFKLLVNIGWLRQAKGNINSKR